MPIKYNPPQRVCVQCGRTFIAQNPQEYLYKAYDWRKGSRTKGRTLWFCSGSCMNTFNRENQKVEHRKGFKS